MRQLRFAEPNTSTPRPECEVPINRVACAPMSDLTALVALLFLMGVFVIGSLWMSRMAHELGMRIITGVANGMPLAPTTREGILFNMWLPILIAAVVLSVFGGLGFLEMARHVNGAGVKQLAYLAAFLLVCNAALVFVSTIFGLFQFRAKIRRDQQGT